MIYFHADDYGITVKQSQMILDCYENGVLNSVSIMPNSEHLEECLGMLEGKDIRRVVHLNFIEGRSVAPKEEVPLLVNQEGMLRGSFGYLLKASMGIGVDRATIKQQLKIEILAQIRVASQDKRICVDGHQHLHMIPVVMEALMEVVAENGYQLEMLRVSVDPYMPLFTTPSLWSKVRVIDRVKWWVLKICKALDRKLLEEYQGNIPCFFGIFFTCRMEYEVVNKLLPKYAKYARKRKMDLELMLHPGGIYENEDLLDANQLDLVDFYKSEYRNNEKITFYRLDHDGLK